MYPTIILSILYIIFILIMIHFVEISIRVYHIRNYYLYAPNETRIVFLSYNINNILHQMFYFT